MSIRSLIIDDDPFIKSLLGDMITMNFPDVEILDTAKSGKEGIEKIEIHQPDLIFLDVEMTDMTGFEMLGQFENPSFQIIFITSYNQYVLKALRMNALDYLIKPIKFEDLQRAINSCISKLGQKKNAETIKATLTNLEELILNILPKEIAKEIKENGSTKPKHYDLVTVFFADIKGFSRHAERLNPVELLEELNYYYSAFDLIMEKYGVEKIKTIGDAYMAAAGVPTHNKTNPYDALKAALAILEFIEKTTVLREQQGKQPFEFRIGIHSGPVVAGIVGLKKFAYDIWGDTVNIASRMEESGTVGKINISRSTYDLLKGHSEFSFTPRGKIHAKGKGMLEMFYVER